MACVELERARRAGPSPREEQRRRCPPARRCSLTPAGQPPLKLTGAATSAAPSAATLSAHRRVSTPYPLTSVVSSAVLPPGHKSRSHCPLSTLLRHRMRCGMCGVSCRGPAKRNQGCCVSRFHRESAQAEGYERRGAPLPESVPGCPLFDTAKFPPG